MPNACNFEMKVIGSEESVDKFYEVLSAHYSLDKGLNNPKHFYRVFDSYSNDSDRENGIKTEIFGGSCAWSVSACFRNGEASYYKEDNKDNGVCLESLTKELGLTVEYYSMEPGVGFNEHAIIKRNN